MTGRDYDLVVIGGGPGGYVAAIRAAQLGMSVACIDQHAQLGGTCLRVGCIPSKALLESTERYREARHTLHEHGVRVGEVTFDLAALQRRKEQIVATLAQGVAALCQQQQISIYQGHARLQGPGQVRVQQRDTEVSLHARRVLVATGSRSATLPGVELDGDRIGTSTEALAYDQVPQRLVVIGAGFIGLELGSVWSRLGAEVIVLEALPRVLPGVDLELARLAQRLLEKQGLQFRLETHVPSARVQGDRCVVECQGAAPIDCDRVLLAVGRVANTQDLGLESVGAEVDARGELIIGPDFQTTAPGVYAIGDCVRGPKLAHKASHEALACVDAFAGHSAQVNYDAIPGVVYTHPELASVGHTEDALKAAGREYRKGVFPFQASGRARTLGETDGRVKILADASTDRVLGVHILGPRAGELIAEAAAALTFGASAEDLAHICHAHPTLAESLGEAAAAVHLRAIHIAAPPRPRAGKPGP